MSFLRNCLLLRRGNPGFGTGALAFCQEREVGGGGSAAIGVPLQNTRPAVCREDSGVDVSVEISWFSSCMTVWRGIASKREGTNLVKRLQRQGLVRRRTQKSKILWRQEPWEPGVSLGDPPWVACLRSWDKFLRNSGHPVGFGQLVYSKAASLFSKQVTEACPCCSQGLEAPSVPDGDCHQGTELVLQGAWRGCPWGVEGGHLKWKVGVYLWGSGYRRNARGILAVIPRAPKRNTDGSRWSLSKGEVARRDAARTDVGPGWDWAYAAIRRVLQETWWIRSTEVKDLGSEAWKHGSQWPQWLCTATQMQIGY